MRNTENPKHKHASNKVVSAYISRHFTLLWWNIFQFIFSWFCEVTTTTTKIHKMRMPPNWKYFSHFSLCSQLPNERYTTILMVNIRNENYNVYLSFQYVCWFYILYSMPSKYWIKLFLLCEWSTQKKNRFNWNFTT